MKKKVAIVIPFYHKELTETEVISFQNCLDTFGKKYPIILIVPEKTSNCTSPFYKDFMCEIVPDDWLKSVASYNKMLLTEEFYTRFLNYEYILIFQLDAFVFSDLLEVFCEYGYDYIGAPWLKGIRYLRNLNRGVWFVGNGGFSLRKIASFITILRSLSAEYIDNINRHEDVFWASCESAEFRVAPIDVALKFSFEQDVRQCFEKNDFRLPFGCHAWEKYDFDFWRPIFEKKGYFLNCSMPVGLDYDVNLSRWDYQYLGVEPIVVKMCLDKLFGEISDNIYIIGLGKIGMECCWLLQRIEGQIIYYIDSDFKNYGKKLWNVSIDPPEILDSIQENYGILVADKTNEKDIIRKLSSKGLKYGKEIFVYDDLIGKLRNCC